MNRENDGFKIVDAITSVKSISSDLAVLLVVNLKGDKTDNDYQDYSIQTEYFSEKELNQLVAGFRSLGCYVDISNGEKAFISKLEAGNFSVLTQPYKIVYNSTGSGIARSRSSLVPSLCALYNLAYCSNDIYTSAILENKVHFLNLLSYYDFKVPKYWVYDKNQGWLNGKPTSTDGLLIAKPAYECASIGISDQSTSVFSASFELYIEDLSYKLDQPILVEEFIEGYEVEVPVFDHDKALSTKAVGITFNGKKDLGNKYLTYQRVYSDNYEFYNYEDQNADLAQKVKDIAVATYNKLNLRGTVRVDFRITRNGDCYIIDYNNSPHITENHSCAYSVKLMDFSYTDLLCLVLYKSVISLKNSETIETMNNRNMDALQ